MHFQVPGYRFSWMVAGKKKNEESRGLVTLAATENLNGRGGNGLRARGGGNYFMIIFIEFQSGSQLSFGGGGGGGGGFCCTTDLLAAATRWRRRRRVAATRERVWGM
jgi:hypothetical protein